MSANLPSTAVPELTAAVSPHLRADFPTEDDAPVDNLYSEKQRAEQERQRAEQEKQRADRLAAQLRALGIGPESSA